MKNKIAILGSTGSIGKTLINILKKDKKNIEITLLTTNQNINELFKQVKIFNVKNVIIINQKKYLFFKKNLKDKKINVYNSFNSINKILNEFLFFLIIFISVFPIEPVEPNIAIFFFINLKIN